MNTYTDNQLKQALAKMLPELIVFVDKWDDTKVVPYLIWNNTGEIVEDTELLHLCWLVEEELNHNESEDYSELVFTAGQCCTFGCVHATWQQRVVALAKVKGVEIV